jgi:hypothetical protein
MEQFRFPDAASAREHADYRCWIDQKSVQGLQLRIAATERLVEVEQSRRARLERSKELRRCGEDKSGTGPTFCVPVVHRKE